MPKRQMRKKKISQFDNRDENREKQKNSKLPNFESSQNLSYPENGNSDSDSDSDSSEFSGLKFTLKISFFAYFLH